MTLYSSMLRRRSWLLLFALLGPAVALSIYIPKVSVEAGTDVLLDEGDPDLYFYYSTRPDWGSDEYAFVCAPFDNIFTREGITALRELTDELRKVPHSKNVVSILDVPLFRQSPGDSTTLLPKTVRLEDPACDLESAKREILEHTQTKNLISSDGRDLMLLVSLTIPAKVEELDPKWYALKGRLATDPTARAELEAIRPEFKKAVDELRLHREELVRGVRDVAARWSERLGAPVRLSGIPIVNINLLEHVDSDLRFFGIGSLVMFFGAFLLIFRRLRWALLPVLTSLLPVLIVLGVMGRMDRSLTIITSNLPVLLFVLMLPYSVYFIQRWRELRAANPTGVPQEQMIAAATSIWSPCLFSCITSVAGFASLLTSGVVPIWTFGLMMSIGMLVGIACVFLFLPSAALKLTPESVRPNTSDTRPKGIVRLLDRITQRFPRTILLIGMAHFGLSVWGVLYLNVETKFIDYFRSGSEIYQGLEYIDVHLGGTTPLEVVLESPREEFFKTPEGLAVIEATEEYFDTVPEVGSVRSLKRIYDEARKAFPKMSDVRLLKTIIKLAEDPVRDVALPGFRKARIVVQMRETAPTLNRNRIIAGLREHLDQKVRSVPEWKEVQVRETGVFLLYANMLNTLIQSQRDTFVMVVVMIYLMLVVLFRSPVLALLVLTPQVLPAMVVLGIMGWAGVPLDMVTVMIASVALGVGIDAAIQYTVRYRLELAIDGDRRAAMTRSHATIGRSIWLATSIIIAGFCFLVFSQFIPTVYFGIFTALAMLAGQFAALTLLPALFLVTGIPRTPVK